MSAIEKLKTLQAIPQFTELAELLSVMRRSIINLAATQKEQGETIEKLRVTVFEQDYPVICTTRVRVAALEKRVFELEHPSKKLSEENQEKPQPTEKRFVEDPQVDYKAT